MNAASIVLTLRQTGRVYVVPPWRAAVPDAGERCVVDEDDEVARRFRVRFPATGREWTLMVETGEGEC